MKKFIFRKFGGLQAYSWQRYYQMTSSQVFFTSILCSSHAPPPPPTPLNSYKIFLKTQVHLFFGCFVICIYCIDSVTSMTFYGLSPSKKYCYVLHWKAFKTNGKCFLFSLKSSFHSEHISVFVTTFWSCRENGLIRRIRLTSKFMASQPGLQTIVIHNSLISHKVKITRQWNLVN